MKKIFLALYFTFFVVLFAQAQRIKLIEGNPKVLSEEKKLNVIFTYDNMRVGKYDKEQDYVNNKKEEYNKKESGKGDRWEQSWIGDRAARYEPNFIDLFEKNTSFALGKFPDAKYTLKINTTRLEPGFNIYISRKNAEIDLEVTIVETESGKTIAQYTIKNAPGRTFGGNDYDSGERIEEAYATAGKHFGKTLKGDVK